MDQFSIIRVDRFSVDIYINLASCNNNTNLPDSSNEKESIEELNKIEEETAEETSEKEEISGDINKLDKESSQNKEAEANYSQKNMSIDNPDLKLT